MRNDMTITIKQVQTWVCTVMVFFVFYAFNYKTPASLPQSFTYSETAKPSKVIPKLFAIKHRISKDHSKLKEYFRGTSSIRSSKRIYRTLPPKAPPNNNSIQATVSSSINEGGFRNCTITYDLDICSCRRTVTACLPKRMCPVLSATPEEIHQDIKNAFGESTCSNWATLRGPKQKIVSYSVHGTFPNDYFEGLKLLIPRVAEVYPGWNVRVYHRLDTSDTSIRTWLCSLACQYPHLDFCHVEKLPGNISHAAGRVWRFSVMGDSLVDQYMVRDSDSPILQREVDAVAAWMSSGTCFHVMRDNIFHRASIMAGMWGGCNDWKTQEISFIRDQIIQNVTRGLEDQAALQSMLWPLAQQNATSHDSFTCRRFPGTRPFPSQRVHYTFVGQRTYRKKYRREITLTQCPWRCRPREHTDWLYC